MSHRCCQFIQGDAGCGALRLLDANTVADALVARFRDELPLKT